MPCDQAVEIREGKYKWTWEPELSPSVMDTLKLNRTKLMATARLAAPLDTLVKGAEITPESLYPVIGVSLPAEYFRRYNGVLWEKVSGALVPCLEADTSQHWSYPGGKNSLQHMWGIFRGTHFIPSFIGTVTAFKNRYRGEELTTAAMYKVIYDPSDSEGEESEGDEAEISQPILGEKRKMSQMSSGGKRPRALAALL